MTTIEEQARAAFPGSCVPNRRKYPEQYQRWVGRMALWAFVYGPALGLNGKEGVQ